MSNSKLYRDNLSTATKDELLSGLEYYGLDLIDRIKYEQGYTSIADARTHYQSLSDDEAREIVSNWDSDENILLDSAEDDIMDDFINGNWTDGANKMLEEYITPIKLAEWLEEMQEEGLYSHVDLSYMVSICNAYEAAVRNRD